MKILINNAKYSWIAWITNQDGFHKAKLSCPFGVPIGIKRAMVGEHKLDIEVQEDGETKRYKGIVTNVLYKTENRKSDYGFEIQRVN